MSRDDGIIGVSDHVGWAVLVTGRGRRDVLDRRRVELVDEDLPKIRTTAKGRRFRSNEAVALVERVRVSAERHAKLGLDAGRILASRFASAQGCHQPQGDEVVENTQESDRRISFDSAGHREVKTTR